jgi:hypothetical protein
MNFLKLRIALCIAALCGASIALAQPPVPVSAPAPVPAEPLVFDQVLKDYTPKAAKRTRISLV